MMPALKRREPMIPRDVMITGFDGLPESAVVEPALTTAEIPSSEIRRFADILLLNRLKHPNTPCRAIYYKTGLIFRGTTR